MKKFNFLVLIISLLFLLSACINTTSEHPNKNASNDSLNWKVQSFSYTDQNEKTFSIDKLKGKVWLANFIFTNCETVCPPMTAHMAKLQKMLADQKVDTQIVSFSVDPKRDTPENLFAFGKKFGADFSHWHFLTGYEQKEIETFAKNSFKTAVSADPTSDQFVHGTSFYLVNQEKKVVKRYDGVQNVPFDQIVKDAKKVLNQPR
ncbi:SCO family protein [Fictibacillus sp. FJAT-27399]|uniref:SCO family protein n=1 Tax=Fictibacillus sp. FJAT-27399 TaxID=1729689 RepID=UPI0007830886|nr:SCO family protein [Fictibacillus sp. FJAT-27399]